MTSETFKVSAIPMANLVLNEEQTRLVESSDGSVEFIGSSGCRIGSQEPSQAGVSKRIPFTMEEAEELARRINSGGPFCTMDEVLDHGRSLDQKPPP